MPSYDAPLRDMKFVMQEMLNIGQLTEYEKFAEADTDTLDAILEQSAKFSSEVLTPLNVVGDQEGCTRNADGSVTTPTGFKEAYQMGLSESPEFGGLGMPSLWSTATGEMQSSANMAFAMYPGLTGSAAKAIRIGGTDAQKQTYLPKMISGEWTGTMNLTEPHCGMRTVLIKLPVRRFLSRRVNIACQIISFIWSWPVLKALQKGLKVFPYLLYLSLNSTRTKTRLTVMP